MRYAGMASNRGRNLLHLDDREPGGTTLAVVVSNHADAPVIDAASERGIDTAVVERHPDETDDAGRRAHERRILDALADYDFDLVCLDGYMRVLTDAFLDAAPTTLNVHPSLLPSFPGTTAHADALDAGVRVTGCTIHVATEDVDAGPIVTQEPVPVREGDTPETLKDRVLHKGEFRAYPRAVGWFARDGVTVAVDHEAAGVRIEADDGGSLPVRRLASNDRAAALRYGENPHQDAALYGDAAASGPSVVDATQRNPGAKALSYNNYNDADAALALVREFDRPAAAVVKHTNPAGCAAADALVEAYDRALATDPMSAFGGIVACNRPCGRPTAAAIVDSFKEVVVAPGYTDGALDVFEAEDDLRVLETGPLDAGGADGQVTEKRLVGGRLVQERDGWAPAPEDLTVVTERVPTDEELSTMGFAWRVVKHTKSNAIVFADGTETVGVGAGQMSRVDAVRLAAMKADEHAEGKSADDAVMASDAFFPFPDGVERAAEAGIEAVVQPGGSVNDDDVIEACDDLGLAMAFTDHRAFRHD
jgi:phosphoribosylaminoimidazolecarboxamide formyltransferase/IMP cyclohydrolase